MRYRTIAAAGLISLLLTGCKEEACKKLGADPEAVAVRDRTLEDTAKDYCRRQEQTSRVKKCIPDMHPMLNCSGSVRYTLHKILDSGKPNGCETITIGYDYNPFTEEWENPTPIIQGECEKKAPKGKAPKLGCWRGHCL
ncbi:MAG: hypothetical protein ACE5DM_00265 [Candidatus Nanoarchaeia archaeon]